MSVGREKEEEVTAKGGKGVTSIQRGAICTLLTAEPPV